MTPTVASETSKSPPATSFTDASPPSKPPTTTTSGDHDHYRQLTQSDGVLRWTGSELEVHLVPQVNHPPKLRKIIVAHLEELNTSSLVLPDGSGRPLRFRLTRSEQISVRINDIA